MNLVLIQLELNYGHDYDLCSHPHVSQIHKPVNFCSHSLLFFPQLPNQNFIVYKSIVLHFPFKTLVNRIFHAHFLFIPLAFPFKKNICFKAFQEPIYGTEKSLVLLVNLKKASHQRLQGLKLPTHPFPQLMLLQRFPKLGLKITQRLVD